MANDKKHQKARNAAEVRAQLVPLLYMQKAVEDALAGVYESAKELGVKVKSNGNGLDVDVEKA